MDLRSKLHWNPKRLVPPMVLAVLAIGYLTQASTFGDNTSAEAPELYGSVLLGLSFIVFLFALLPSAKARENHSLIVHDDFPLDWKITSKIFGMTGAFVALVFITGFYFAIPFFLVLFLKFVSRMSFISSTLLAATALGLTWFLFSYVLNLEVFTGYIADYF